MSPKAGKIPFDFEGLYEFIQTFDTVETLPEIEALDLLASSYQVFLKREDVKKSTSMENAPPAMLELFKSVRDMLREGSAVARENFRDNVDASSDNINGASVILGGLLVFLARTWIDHSIGALVQENKFSELGDQIKDRAVIEAGSDNMALERVAILAFLVGIGYGFWLKGE